MLEANIGARLRGKMVLEIATSFKIILLILPEKTEGVHIHDYGDDDDDDQKRGITIHNGVLW